MFSVIISVTVRTSSDTDFLKNGSQSAQDENDEIERRLRSEVLASNSDRFFSRFNERKHRIVITINAGKNKARRDFEEELEVFYDGFRDNPPTPMAQMRFLLRQRKWAFLLSFLIKIGRSLPMIVIPIISANIIDIVQAGSLEGNLPAFLVNLGAGILSLVLHILFVYLDAAYFQELCRTIGENLRNVLVRKLQLLAMSFHDEAHAGAIANKILNSVEELYGKGRMFNHMILAPGRSIGEHRHEGDNEIFYFLKGSGLYNDNGTPVRVHPGDTAVCNNGECHSLVNDGDEPLELIALILY